MGIEELDDGLLDEFREESHETLESCERALLLVERPETYQDGFKEVFRAFHSLKGLSSMFGLDDIEKTFHFLESLLTKYKALSFMPSEMVDYLLAAVDSTSRMINGQTVNFELYDPIERANEESGSAPVQQTPSSQELDVSASPAHANSTESSGSVAKPKVEAEPSLQAVAEPEPAAEAPVTSQPGPASSGEPPVAPVQSPELEVSGHESVEPSPADVPHSKSNQVSNEHVGETKSDQLEARSQQDPDMEYWPHNKEPRVDLEELANQLNKTNKPKRKMVRIYVVDDETDLLLAYEDILGSLDFDVSISTFESAEAALKEYDRTPMHKLPQLIISDIKMQGLSGLDFIKQMSKRNPNIPFIFMSGYLDDETFKVGLEHGAYGILAKPIKVMELKFTIYSAIRYKESLDLVRKSLKFLFYVFGTSQGLGHKDRVMLENEIKSIMSQVDTIRAHGKKSA